MIKQTTYPSFLQAIGISLLFVFLQLTGGLITGSFGTLMGISQDSSLMFFLNLYLLPVALGVIIIGFYCWRSGQGWKDLWGAKTGTWLFYPIIILMFVGLSFVLSEVDNWVRFFYPVTAAWEEVFTNIYSLNIWLSFFGVAVIPPILEEVVFRGIILRGFLNRYGLWVSITVSSLLFAAMHINIWQMIPAFIAGFFLGYIFYKTESLMVTVFAHAVFNATAVLGNHFFTIPGFNDGSLFQPAWLTFGAMGIVILALILFNHIHRRVTVNPIPYSPPGYR